MRLSDLTAFAELEVVRDGEFQSVGLLFHETPKLLVCLYEAKARRGVAANDAVSCVIATPELASSVPDTLGLALAAAPREAFVDIHRQLGSETDFYGADFPTEISPQAQIDAGARVAERKVRIAPGCLIEPGAVVLEGSVLAEDVVVRTGAVVGAEGFFPMPYGDGLAYLPHHGSVRLGRGVEIGTNSVVTRSVFLDPTEIGETTFIGALVYIAHGAQIGSRCRLAPTSRIAGSARLGDDVYVGPGGVVSNRVAVGDGARVSLGSVVVRDVAPGQTVTGNFAVDHDRFLASWRRQLSGQEAGEDRG